MDQPRYSFPADLLSKFHMASAPIQALWLLVAGAVTLAVAFGVMNLIRELVVKRRAASVSVPPGELLIGVFETADGRRHIYRREEIPPSMSEATDEWRGLDKKPH